MCSCLTYCDTWLFHTAMALSGMRPSLIYHGVISNHLPSLIQLGNPTLQATTTKHSRQVWLSALSKIDITLSHGASAIKCFWKVGTQTLQSKVADSCGQPRCDRCFKEFADSLTSLLHSLLLYPPTPTASSLTLLPVLPVVFLYQSLWLK